MRLRNLLKFRVDLKLQAICLVYLAHKRKGDEDDAAARVFSHMDDSGVIRYPNLLKAFDYEADRVE